MIDRIQLQQLYERACEVELLAFKPGNVSVYSEGHDMTVEDFRTSYRVSSPPLTDPSYSLGEKIYYAVRATREAVSCNTNLGILLLCAPLLQAASNLRGGGTLRSALHEVLDATTREDAKWVFKAIVLASPGGLGESDEHDVAAEKATVTLLEAMRTAADKDRIAYQFVSNFKNIFEYAIFMYNANLAKFGNQIWAALSVYAGMLTRYADSHIERKYGPQFSAWVATEMQRVLDALASTDDPESLLPMLRGIDEAFKAKDINPGTTADITVATLLTVYLQQLIGE